MSPSRYDRKKIKEFTRVTKEQRPRDRHDKKTNLCETEEGEEYEVWSRIHTVGVSPKKTIERSEIQSGNNQRKHRE